MSLSSRYMSDRVYIIAMNFKTVIRTFNECCIQCLCFKESVFSSDTGGSLWWWLENGLIYAKSRISLEVILLTFLFEPVVWFYPRSLDYSWNRCWDAQTGFKWRESLTGDFHQISALRELRESWRRAVRKIVRINGDGGHKDY